MCVASDNRTIVVAMLLFENEYEIGIIVRILGVSGVTRNYLLIAQRSMLKRVNSWSPTTRITRRNRLETAGSMNIHNRIIIKKLFICNRDRHEL